MMLSPSGRSRKGSSSQTAGALSSLSCSACVTGIGNVSIWQPTSFDPQLLLHHPSQWSDLLVNARREDHASERGACRLRIENRDDRPVLLCCDRCQHELFLLVDQV